MIKPFIANERKTGWTQSVGKKKRPKITNHHQNNAQKEKSEIYIHQCPDIISQNVKTRIRCASYQRIVTKLEPMSFVKRLFANPSAFKLNFDIQIIENYFVNEENQV
jgi:hypothetical protein